MSKSRLVLLVVAGVFLIGCNDVPQPSNEKLQTENRSTTPFRRFEPAFSTDGYGIALDTVTGRWCKAWNWTMHPTNPTLMGLNDLPLCADIITSGSGATLLRPQFKVGDDVMLNGKKVKIKKIYPDGAFDY